MRCVKGDEDLMVITNHGIVIRTPLEQVKIAGRNTQGVKIIALEARNKVASLAIVPHIDETEEEEAPVEEDEINPALVAQEEAAPEVKVVTPDQLDEDIDHAVSEDVTTDE